MPLRLRGFLICFVLLCVAFVPVVYLGGLAVMTAPVSALLLRMLQKGIDRVSFWMGIHAFVYVALFAGVGALGYSLVHQIRWRVGRIVLFVFMLVLPVCALFARVITYSSIQGRGGTYTFWEAVERYFERLK